LRYFGTDTRGVMKSEGLQFDSNAVEEKKEFLTCPTCPLVGGLGHGDKLPSLYVYDTRQVNGLA